MAAATAAFLGSISTVVSISSSVSVSGFEVLGALANFLALARAIAAATWLFWVVGFASLLVVVSVVAPALACFFALARANAAATRSSPLLAFICCWRFSAANLCFNWRCCFSVSKRNALSSWRLRAIAALSASTLAVFICALETR